MSVNIDRVLPSHDAALRMRLNELRQARAYLALSPVDLLERQRALVRRDPDATTTGGRMFLSLLRIAQLAGLSLEDAASHAVQVQDRLYDAMEKR